MNVREVVNAIVQILTTGRQWRALPKDLPPRGTVHDYLDLWSYDGTLDHIHHALYGSAASKRGEKPVPPRLSSTVKRKKASKRQREH